MQLSKAIEGFNISALAAGYSPLTLAAYRSSLGILAKYLVDPEISDITPERLNGFMLYLRTSYQPVRRSGSTAPLSTASLHRYWKAIRSFFKWAGAELGVERPDLTLKMPAYTNREIIPFSEDEIRRLLKASERAEVPQSATRQAYTFRRPNRCRDKALLLLLLDTGVRAGECGRLQVGDVNLETGEVSVRPHHVRKTRPRTVYLGAAARRSLWRYLADRSADRRPDDPLFLTVKGQAMNRTNLRSVCWRLGKAAHVGNCHPHRFRHTFAIQYLRNGGDVFTLQRLLGHSTLEMVRHYLALADSDAITAHQKASPVDRWRL